VSGVDVLVPVDTVSGMDRLGDVDGEREVLR
jgi:hypothetical protein